MKEFMEAIVSDQQMENPSDLSSGRQRVEGIGAVAEKKAKKLKVRHLSELTKRIIVQRYSVLLDFDEVATAMEIPGITGKTVANVIAASLLTTRKPPTRELPGAAAQWRSA